MLVLPIGLERFLELYNFMDNKICAEDATKLLITQDGKKYNNWIRRVKEVQISFHCFVYSH